MPMLASTQRNKAGSSMRSPAIEARPAPTSFRVINFRSRNMCEDCKPIGRRSLLTGLASATGAAAIAAAGVGKAKAADNPYADPKNPILPNPGMKLDLERTALVVIDPQIDFLSQKGAAWPVLGASVTEQNVVSNLARL